MNFQKYGGNEEYDKGVKVANTLLVPKSDELHSSIWFQEISLLQHPRFP